MNDNIIIIFIYKQGKHMDDFYCIFLSSAIILSVCSFSLILLNWYFYTVRLSIISILPSYLNHILEVLSVPFASHPDNQDLDFSKNGTNKVTFFFLFTLRHCCWSKMIYKNVSYPHKCIRHRLVCVWNCYGLCDRFDAFKRIVLKHEIDIMYCLV